MVNPALLSVVDRILLQPAVIAGSVDALPCPGCHARREFPVIPGQSGTKSDRSAQQTVQQRFTGGALLVEETSEQTQARSDERWSCRVLDGSPQIRSERLVP